MTIDAHDLNAAAADPESPAWSRIWGESCHQGTCTPGSPALLPWLARTSAGFRSEQRTRAVALAGFIALDATEADRAEYRDDIETLRRVTREGLPGALSGTTCPGCDATFDLADHVV